MSYTVKIPFLAFNLKQTQFRSLFHTILMPNEKKANKTTLFKLKKNPKQWPFDSTCQLIPKQNILILKQIKLFVYTVQAAAKAYNTLHYKVQNPNYIRGTFFPGLVSDRYIANIKYLNSLKQITFLVSTHNGLKCVENCRLK